MARGNEFCEALFDWWAFGQSDWDTFRAERDYPQLFGTEIEGEKGKE